MEEGERHRDGYRYAIHVKDVALVNLEDGAEAEGSEEEGL
jgi:hypothetical protein